MKQETINKLCDCGVLAVLRAPNPEMAIHIAEAIVPSGVVGLEITYTVPGAGNVIKTLHNDPRFSSCLVGAGTVLDEKTAKDAISNGAPSSYRRRLIRWLRRSRMPRTFLI